MVQVSHLKLEDKNHWEALYKDYASFYSLEMSQGTLELVWSWINNDSFPFYGLAVKSSDGKIIGIAHYRSMPSPVRGAIVGFLDDLYIHPEARGGDAVQEVFKYLKAECKSHGWPFMRWITKENNYRARSAYEKVALKTDWITYQLNV